VGGGFTADPAELHVRMHPSLQALELAPARQDDLPWLVKPVRDYFEGDVGAFDGLTVHQPGTPSRQRLWAAMRAVAPGTTVSYAVLAAQAGNPGAPRAASRGHAGSPPRLT
jgi:methylated-DNA-[protein]-cysteine S-methyltransferase